MATQWTKIRAEWLKGGTTYQKLADKYGLKEKTIRNRAYKEGWSKQKGQIRDKMEAETRERVVRARVNHLERLIAANEALLEGLEKMAALIQDKPMEMLVDKQRTIKNAESFAKALQTAVATQRDLYRLPTIDQKFAAKKWREQLKLEKEKASKDTVTDDKLVWVIHEPAEEGDPDA